MSAADVGIAKARASLHSKRTRSAGTYDDKQAEAVRSNYKHSEATSRSADACAQAGEPSAVPRWLVRAGDAAHLVPVADLLGKVYEAGQQVDADGGHSEDERGEVGLEAE